MQFFVKKDIVDFIKNELSICQVENPGEKTVFFYHRIHKEIRTMDEETFKVELRNFLGEYGWFIKENVIRTLPDSNNQFELITLQPRDEEEFNNIEGCNPIALAFGRFITGNTYARYIPNNQ